MTTDRINEIIERMTALLEEADAGELRPGELSGLVQAVLDRRDLFLASAERFGTPQYFFDEHQLLDQVRRFCRAFESVKQPVCTHYAFKANPSLPVVEAMHRVGINADVSSGLELELALRCGFQHIVLSGPAKTDAELRLALEHADRVTVHMDSFRELRRLDELAAESNRHINVGIRLNTQSHGNWTKFGIPLASLPDLVQTAETASRVSLRGIQFHLSWNRDAGGYVKTLTEVGRIMRDCTPSGGWQFVDVGGGFYPEDDEAVYPWLTDHSRLLSIVDGTSSDSPPKNWDLRYLLHKVDPIETMAAEILDAFQTQVRCFADAALWLEPGRYLINQAVHVLLSVADVKGADIAITDGGTNLLGWERLEGEHCPLINLTHPAVTQRRAQVYGSLCTPHDLWGFAYYGSEIKEGDILMVPAQGAYVQTLAQRFIKPICQTVMSSVDGNLNRVTEEETIHDRYPGLA